MASVNVVPSSDITTTDWTTTGSSFYGVLSASSGAGDGTHYVYQNSGTGGTNNLICGCTLSTTGWISISGVTYTVAWLENAKSSTAYFQLTLNSNGGGTELASMASAITTTSSSETTTGPNSMTLNNSTPSNWTNFQMVIACTSGNVTGQKFGLYVTITYSTSAATGPPNPINLYGGRIAGSERLYGGPAKTITAYGFR